MFFSPQQRKAVICAGILVQAGIAGAWLQRQVPAVYRFVEARESDGAIDINQATFEQLMRTRAVPAHLARRIIEFRGSCGGFSSIEQLQEVKGIGPKRYEKLKGLFSVR